MSSESKPLIMKESNTQNPSPTRQHWKSYAYAGLFMAGTAGCAGAGYLYSAGKTAWALFSLLGGTGSCVLPCSCSVASSLERKEIHTGSTPSL